jgi:hypothetical protein
MSLTKTVTSFSGEHDHDLDWASLDYVGIQCRSFALAVSSLPDGDRMSSVFALLPNFSPVSQNCTRSSAPKFDVEALRSGVFSFVVQKVTDNSCILFRHHNKKCGYTIRSSFLQHVSAHWAIIRYFTCLHAVVLVCCYSSIGQQTSTGARKQIKYLMMAKWAETFCRKRRTYGISYCGGGTK